MTETKPYRKEKNELRKQLVASVEFVSKLLTDAFALDYNNPLREEYAKSIAVKLRVLLISGKAESVIEQLNMCDKMLFPSICVSSNDIPGNLIHYYGLVGEKISEKESFFFPGYKKNDTELRCTLNCWLEEVIFDRKQEALHKVSRKDIILCLSDKEGGAHVDTYFEPEYYNIAYNSGFELVLDDGRVIKSRNNCYAEALFTIALEFIESFDEYRQILMGASYNICENDLSFIELIYKDKSTRKRFLHNSMKDIINMLPISYDYLHTVEYKLLFSKNYLFIKNGAMFYRKVIDDSEAKDILFCICGPDKYLYIKEKGKYYRIEKDEDLYNISSLSQHTFSQVIRFIRSQEKVNIDCLKRQRLYIDSISE